MKKFNYENIKSIHLELTTKCNAMCPMCNRNFKGKVRKNLPIVELSLDSVKKILTKDFLNKINYISICGVYGEPICNSDLKKILNYIYKCNSNMYIEIYTNGGLYNKLWWKDLANILKKHNGLVIFGIDGIGEVHSLHRCNVDYNKVIENAKSYISAGGIAQWDYIVFKHNEHQVEDAKRISKELGFKTFQVKKTSRFLKKLYEKDEMLDSTILDYGKHPVFDKDGELSYFIELPKNSIYRNKSEDIMFDKIEKYGSISKYLDEVKIDCSSLKNGGIFISAFGEVFPCCTVYQQVCYKTIHNVSDKNELNEYMLYKNYNLNANDKSIKDIVNGEFFMKLCESFSCNSIANGKPKACSRACGKNIDLHKNGHTTEIKYERK